MRPRSNRSTSWFWPSACDETEEEVELKSHIEYSLDKIQDMLNGKILTYHCGASIPNTQMIFNPSIRKMYQWTGPIEVILAGVELYLLYDHEHLNKNFLPKTDVDAKNPTLALIEVWLELILIGAMLIAGGCHLMKKYLWPALYKLHCVKSSFLFKHNGLLDNLYQSLGRIEGAAGVSTLGILMYEKHAFKSFLDIWSLALTMVATIMVFIDAGMYIVSKSRESSSLPDAERLQLSMLLRKVCKAPGEDNTGLINKLAHSWSGTQSFSEWIIDRSGSNRINPITDVRTYKDLKKLFKAIQHLQEQLDTATQDTRLTFCAILTKTKAPN